MPGKEAPARIRINRLLEQASWCFFPENGKPDNIIYEHRATRKVVLPAFDLGADFDKAPDGFVDYLRLNLERKAVAVVEAKRESINPLEGKEQAQEAEPVKV